MTLATATIASPGGLALSGAVCFGVTVGYITYRTLARTTEKASITDLATVIGAIGGGAITTIYGNASGSIFGLYSIGLLGGMALYLVLSLLFNGKKLTGTMLGSDGVNTGVPGGVPAGHGAVNPGVLGTDGVNPGV